jgi:hypothetical protein
MIILDPEKLNISKLKISTTIQGQNEVKHYIALHENWWQNWKRWMAKLFKPGWLIDEFVSKINNGRHTGKERSGTEKKKRKQTCFKLFYPLTGE